MKHQTWIVLVLLATSTVGLAQEAATPPETAAVIDVQPLKPETADLQKAEGEVTQLDEVMVTATKRKESARTLAGAVTAIGGERLKETGASNFGEYLSLSPGVNYNSGVPGYSVVTIRGVSSDTVPGTAQTAVGIYYDDIPLTDPAAPLVVPDIDAFDAERVELLRGPQGALFGSASLGGAVNYIPEAPAYAVSQFAAQASGSLTTNSSLAGGGKLMLNAPLFDDNLALRAVGYYTNTPGYIDNVGTGVEQSNNSHTGGGRVMLGWQPNSDSTLRLTGLYQRTEVEDSGYIDDTRGDLQKSTIAPEPSFNEIRLASLRYELETEHGSWALIGGYQDKASGLDYDGATALGIGALGQRVILTQAGEVKGYSAELRYVSPDSDRFTWLAGLSYADRDEEFRLVLDAATLAGAVDALRAVLEPLNLPLPPVVLATATLFRQRADVSAPEAAAFVDGTFYFTPSFKLSAGGRYYRNQVKSHVVANGLLVLPAGSTESIIDQNEKATGFNPKVSLSYQFNRQLMVYALYSKGYRLGGPNLVPNSPLFPANPTYGPDEVKNYELGAKTSWFDGMLMLDVAAFNIDWAEIPLLVVTRGGLFKYLANAGDARIQGIETSIALRPWDFLTARSSITYMDAQLLNDYDPKNNRPPAEAGDQLPGSPDWTVTNSLTGSWFWNDRNPTVTLIHRYEGPSPSNLSFKDVPKGDFNVFDVRAGLKLGAFGITAFCKNITDERAITASNNYAQTTGNVLSLKFIQPPRTVGLELSYSFEQ